MSQPADRRALVESSFNEDLFEVGQKVLVAVSGGGDSMVLLALMVDLAKHKDLEISAAHINYGLRGVDSDRDEQLVSGRCRELGVFLSLERTDELKMTDNNLEERARDLRRRVLHRRAMDIKADRIALGHTLDDQAETILMRLLRGSGLTGLGGMRARDGLWVRPLLGATRLAVRAYAQERGIRYREDQSNNDLRFTRNKIRKSLLPLLVRQYNPNIKQGLVNSAALLREDEIFLQEVTATLYRRLVKKSADALLIPAADFLSLPSALQRRLLRRMLISYAPSLSRVGHGRALLLALDNLRKSDKGMKLDLGLGLTLQRKSGILSLTLSRDNKYLSDKRV